MTHITDIVDATTLGTFLANGTSVVLFTQPRTCAPCRALEPHYAKMPDQLPDVQFLRVNLDKADPELVASYGIMSVPTMLAFVPDKDTAVLQGRTVVALTKEITNLQE